MEITSTKTHTAHFPYRNSEGNIQLVSIYPGKNQVDPKLWKAVEEEMGVRLDKYKKFLTFKKEKGGK